MELYLVQHGGARDEKEDPQRRLTQKGKEETEKVAKLLNVKCDIIMHSGKARARETAEIFAKYLNAKISEEKGLAPLDDVIPWVERLNKEERNIMIVGHLPFLQKLLSVLIQSEEVVKFRYSGCLKLKKEKEKFLVEWFVTPDSIK